MDSEYNDSSLSRMVEYALLYDFYGALLKDKNRAVFEDYMLNDMSLSEISQNFGITRQGVRDIVKDDVVSIRESIIKARDAYDLDDDFICSIEKYLKDIEKKTDSILEEF